MRKTQRAGFAALALAVAVVGLTACGGGSGSKADASDSPLVKAAKKEGELTWYSGDSPESNTAIAKAFEEKYGIRVDVVRAIAGDLENRFTTEASSGKTLADIVWTSDTPFFDKGLNDKLFTPLSQMKIDAFDAFPDKFKSDACAIVSVAPTGVAYNTNLVKPADAPKTWEDLTKPPLSDGLMLVDFRNADAYLAQADLWYTQVGEDYMPELAAAKPKLTQSVVPGAQSLAAGEAKVLVPTISNFIQPLIDSGAPVKFALLSPLSGAEECVAITTKAPHPNAAKLFTDYVLSKEGQAVVAKSGVVTPLGGGGKKVPAGYSSPDYVAGVKNKALYLSQLGLQ